MYNLLVIIDRGNNEELVIECLCTFCHTASIPLYHRMTDTYKAQIICNWTLTHTHIIEGLCTFCHTASIQLYLQDHMSQVNKYSSIWITEPGY